MRVRTPNKDKLNIEHRNSSHRSISNHFDLANQDRANTPSVYARLCSPVKRIAKREASPGPFIYMDRSYYNQSPLRLNPAYELLNRSQSPAALKKAPVDDLNERKAMENIKRYHIASNNPMKIRSVNLNTSIESEPTNLAEIPQINKEVLSKLKIADHELKKRHVNTFRNPAYWKRIQSLY